VTSLEALSRRGRPWREATGAVLPEFRHRRPVWPRAPREPEPDGLTRAGGGESLSGMSGQRHHGGRPAARAGGQAARREDAEDPLTCGTTQPQPARS